MLLCSVVGGICVLEAFGSQVCMLMGLGIWREALMEVLREGSLLECVGGSEGGVCHGDHVCFVQSW